MNRADAVAMTRDLIALHGLDGAGWKPALVNTKSILGQCAYGPKQIRLSTVYVDHNDYDCIRQTILHEIAHALHGPCYKGAREKPHGRRWQLIARSIGVKAPAATKKAEMPDRRYVANCPTCGKVIATRHIIIAAARRFRSRCHSETVVWTDRQAGRPAKPMATAASTLDLDYSQMTPGRKAAYTKRMRAAAVESVASAATLTLSDQSGGTQ